MVEVALAALLRMFSSSFLDDWLAQRANAFLTQTFKPATAPPHLPIHSMSTHHPSLAPPQPSVNDGRTPPRQVAGGGVLVDAFGKMRKRLLQMAQGILGNRMEAEDAVQDAFCRMWTHCSDIRDDGAAAAILTTTTRHVSIDILRKRTPTLDIEDSPEALGGGEPPEWERQERQAEAQQRWQEVQRLIAEALTPEQQLVLRRRDYEGASFEAIAAELHSTTTAVRMHLSRARRKILQTYQALHATGQSDAPPASPSSTPKSPQP